MILNPAVPCAATRHLLCPQWHASPMLVTITVNCGAVGSEANKGRICAARDSTAGFRMMRVRVVTDSLLAWALRVAYRFENRPGEWSRASSSPGAGNSSSRPRRHKHPGSGLPLVMLLSARATHAMLSNTCRSVVLRARQISQKMTPNGSTKTAIATHFQGRTCIRCHGHTRSAHAHRNDRPEPLPARRDSAPATSIRQEADTVNRNPSLAACACPSGGLNWARQIKGERSGRTTGPTRHPAAQGRAHRPEVRRSACLRRRPPTRGPRITSSSSG